MRSRILGVMVAVLALTSLSAYAGDKYSTNMNVLPAVAQKTLKTHFKKDVNHIKIDSGFFGVDSYDVVLNDGTEVEFDSKGNLKEVDCGVNGQVPKTIVMPSIANYVAKNYPKQKIVKYEVKRSGYEVELQSGLDLVFGSDGTFKRIDR